jgi:hypothetical protein
LTCTGFMKAESPRAGTAKTLAELMRRGGWVNEIGAIAPPRQVAPSQTSGL